MGSPLENTPLSAAAASERASLAHWTVQGTRLQATFRVKSMPLGAQLVERIVAAAEDLNHHPDLDLRFRALHISITTHSRGALTEADAALAEQISQIAAELECPPRPAPVLLDITVPAEDVDAVAPFWQALLGYTPTPSGGGAVLGDRAGRMPDLRIVAEGTLSGEGQTPESFLDVHVPHDMAATRVEEAIAAGGVVVDDTHAPRYWVLADAAGNHARVCTWRDAEAPPA